MSTDWTQALVAEVNGDNAPMEVRIFDRNGDPYTGKTGPTVIQVLGEYSDAVKKFDRQQTNKALRGGRAPDADEVNARAAERCAVATVGWNGLTIGGQDVKYDRDNAIRLYTHAEWVRDQVFTAMRSRAGFFGEKSSS